MKSKVRIVLRDPLNKKDHLDYIVQVEDHELARDWIQALKGIVQSDQILEKNFCFMGFPGAPRNVEYLCQQLNRHVKTINDFSLKGVWQSHGLDRYLIQDWFVDQTVRWPGSYPCAHPVWEYPGLSVKHETMNRLHNHFEILQGTVEHLSDYYRYADYETKFAIRQLNNLCHELENAIMCERQWAITPEWTRPSQITTWINTKRFELTPAHRKGFAVNGFDRVLGGVYMHWAQIGKTLLEVFRDEGAPDLDDTVCEAITHLKYYSGEFDVEWGNDVVYGQHAWHTQFIDDFHAWLHQQGLDPNDPALSLGYLSLGRVDLQESFGSADYMDIWRMLQSHLDIYKIEVDSVSKTYDYCWTDDDYESNQIQQMIPGYDHSSRKTQ
jgi:hypothetical protein